MCCELFTEPFWMFKVEPCPFRTPFGLGEQLEMGPTDELRRPARERESYLKQINTILAAIICFLLYKLSINI